MRFMFLRWYSCISRLFPVADVLKFKLFYYRATDARSQSYNAPNIIIKLFLCLIHRVTSDDMVFITKRLHQKVKLSYYYLHFLAFFSRIILPPVQFWSTWFSDIFAYFKAHDLQIYLLIPGHVIYGCIRPIFLLMMDPTEFRNCGLWMGHWRIVGCVIWQLFDRLIYRWSFWWKTDSTSWLIDWWIFSLLIFDSLILIIFIFYFLFIFWSFFIFDFFIHSFIHSWWAQFRLVESGIGWLIADLVYILVVWQYAGFIWLINRLMVWLVDCQSDNCWLRWLVITVHSCQWLRRLFNG